MSLPRVRPSGWGPSVELSYAEINDLDTNVSNALDKRTGATDLLGSIVTMVGAGRLVRSVQNGADADGTYLVGAGAIIRAPALTANRVYTLGTTGALPGDVIEVWVNEAAYSGSAYTVRVVNGASSTTLAYLGALGQSYYAAFIYDVFLGWQPFRGTRRGLVVETFLASGTWVCPAGVGFALGVGCGGGGGGGGGKPNSTSADRWISGGGGGGGALEHCLAFAPTPLSTHNITIGNGGAGGNATFGDDGGDTIVALGGTNLLVMMGAAGGRAQVSTFAISSTAVVRAVPGGPVRGQQCAGWGNFADDLVVNNIPTDIPSFGVQMPWASGGHGNGTSAAIAGRVNATGGFAGGAGGAKGTDSGTNRGGGGGGGGGAGPYGAGASGGAGGNGGGFAGSAGSAAAANTGAGGGGGGSGGTAAGGSGAGGLGGAGGSGRLRIIYAR